MADLNKDAISLTVSDKKRSKRTKIWDHIQIVIRASFVFTLAKTFHDSSYIVSKKTFMLNSYFTSVVHELIVCIL